MKTLSFRLTLFIISLQIVLVYLIFWSFEAFDLSAVYPLLMLVSIMIVGCARWFLEKKWNEQNPMYLTGNIIASAKDYRIWVYVILGMIMLLAIFHITNEFFLPESSTAKRLTFNDSPLLGYFMTLLGGIIFYTILMIGMYKRVIKHWE